MSRFINLEFDGGSGEQSLDAQQGVTLDEHYYMREAQAAFENADFEKALRYFAKVLEFNPQNAAAWAAQVRMLIELAEYREAKIWADKALERFPNEPDLLAAKAVALGRNGDLDTALAFSDASIEERGDTPYVWLARGDVLLARKESLADYCFDKAMMLAHGDWFIAWLAGRIRAYYKQFVLALNLIQQAAAANAGNHVLWLELGRCQEALGFLAPAECSFTQALQLNRQSRAADEALHRLRSHGLRHRLLGWCRRLKK
jgi:tetratricopeptide (TPR) repeat protein